MMFGWWDFIYWCEFHLPRNLLKSIERSSNSLETNPKVSWQPPVMVPQGKWAPFLSLGIMRTLVHFTIEELNDPKKNKNKIEMQRKDLRITGIKLWRHDVMSFPRGILQRSRLRLLGIQSRPTQPFTRSMLLRIYLSLEFSLDCQY